MSLKAKLKPYIFAFGLILGLVFFSSNVFAFEQGLQIEINTPWQNPNYEYRYITQDNRIPSSQFTQTDNNYYLWNSKFIGDGYQIGSGGLDYYTIQSVGYHALDFYLGLASEYSVSGVYYIYMTKDYYPNEMDHIYASFPFYVNKELGTITSQSIDIDGACGTADNVLPVTVPIPDNDACSSGTVDNMREIYTFDGVVFAWECLGSGEGITVSCESLPFPDPIDGACGTADGQSSYNEPDEEDKCLAGATNATTTITLTGWAWTCNGLYGGTNDVCSSTYSGGGTPPEDIEVAPIPTPTDCSSYSGIDEIVCNIGNTIQGLFLPSTSKLTELQNTINDIGNVFPFNYLRAISTVFTNLDFSSGSLTMTMFGNTETLGDDFWNMEIFDNIKLGVTVLILLMFTFWAMGYIKHFFK